MDTCDRPDCEDEAVIRWTQREDHDPDKPFARLTEHARCKQHLPAWASDS